MKYDRAEAVRYMGAKKDDNEAAVLADLAYLQLRNEVRPRSCWQIFACRVDDAGVTLVDNGMRFESKNLAGHLQGCQKAAVLAATLGSNADTVLRRLALTNVAQAAAAQAVCAALIESYCDETEAEIAAAAGLHLKPRFSPGYGDWRLEDQRQLLMLLDCAKRIWLILTYSYILSPIKSVTAVIGLTEDTVCNNSKCAACVNRACEFRKE